MPLTLMYITNNIKVALIAQKAGVDRIWIDMEYIGKEERQGGMDTVKSHHTIEDIKRMRPYVTTAELMVRINPIHNGTDAYMSTEQEIEETIAAGADVIMLPMFKTASEVERFLKCVSGRVKTLLLFETAESIENIDSILSLPGIDEVHIGLNDLHLAYKKSFMFELLCDGTVQKICSKFKEKNIKFGFGGIARVGFGMLPAEYIIAEHYNLGSTAAILSRGFCDANKVDDPDIIEEIFIEGVKNIRLKESEVSNYSREEYNANFVNIQNKVEEIVLCKNNQKKTNKKVCIATTVSVTMKCFVVETAKYLYEKEGYDVTLICSPDEQFEASLPEYIKYVPIKMGRGIDITAVKSIVSFYKVFKKEKFDMVQYSTPNASLYAAISAYLCKVPKRLYCQWGIRYVGMKGIARKVFRMIERFVCKLSTRIHSVSPMNMQFGIDEKLYKPDKVRVVGNGGTIGVDLKEYDISQKNVWNVEIREKLGISQDDFVFGFSGRVSVDKGCGELFEAFKTMVQTTKNVKLLIVGPLEEHCGLDKDLLTWALNCNQIISTGMVANKDMRKYYSAMNVLIHPTYREGFGMVIQEAGAMAVPAVTTNIIGASEVMVNGDSCVLVEPKNTPELYDAMMKLFANGQMCKELGKSAYDRTESLYSRPIMLENQRKAYVEFLNN